MAQGAVNELEARRASREREEAAKKKRMGSIAFVLESTGQLTNRVLSSARRHTSKSSPKARPSEALSC